MWLRCYCFQCFQVIKWLRERVQHFGSTTFGALDTIFEAERWWSYNKSTTVCAEMKIKKERLRNGVTLLKPLKFLLLEVPLQQALEGFAVPRFVAGHFIMDLRPTLGLLESPFIESQ